MTSDDLLARAALRAERDPFYLAWALAAFREGEGADNEALARYLECAPEDLPRLALCRRPDALATMDFARDVEHLAQRFGLRADLLADLLNVTAFLEAASVPRNEEETLLLAARDRNEDSPETHSLRENRAEYGSPENSRENNSGEEDREKRSG